MGVRRFSGFLACAAVAALLVPGEARAQFNPACQEDASSACITITTSITERIVFNPATVTIQRIDTFSTQIIGRLQGGVLFDQTYPVAFTDPQAQGGVAAATLAITTAGGPGVVIAAPVRTQRTETLTSSVSTSLFTLNRTETTEPLEELLGPGTALISFGPCGQFDSACITTATLNGSGATGLGPCASALAGLPSPTPPACLPDTRFDHAVPGGTTNLNQRTDNVHFVDEAREQTDTYLTFEQWEVNGAVVATGIVHTAVQSGLYDLGERLLRQMPEQGSGMWGDVYGMRVRQGDRRTSWGLAGGAGFNPTPELTLVFGIDHGWIDIDVPASTESGDVELTELAASARLDRGPFSAALTGVYGFGSADTLRALGGSSRASYDLNLAGAAIDIGYTVEAGTWRITPVATLDFVSIETDGFTETDIFGLTATDHDSDRTRALAGVKLSRDVGMIAFSAAARYVAVLDGEERSLPVAFNGASGTPLLIQGPDEPGSALIGGRARFTLAPGAALTLAYDGRFGSGYDAHGGSIGLNVRW